VRELDRGPEISMPRRRGGGGDLRAPRRGQPSRLRRILCWLRPARPADTIAVALAAVATAAVLVNALVLQRVPQPAPPLTEERLAVPSPSQRKVAQKPTVPAAPAPPLLVPPQPVPVTPVPPQRPETAAVRPRSELVVNVQRELAQLGLYDGTVDGLLGPRTEQAIREFEKRQGLKISGEPSAMLLDVMRRARPRPETTGAVAPAEPRPSTRVLAVQRSLARLGYGPVKLSGIPDAATRAAIEQFERDRGLARSGEIGERLLAELSAVTGAPIR
jgi:peptidoglycan hydrolase-like protein with peptidoglycan-binding domain